MKQTKLKQHRKRNNKHAIELKTGSWASRRTVIYINILKNTKVLKNIWISRLTAGVLALLRKFLADNDVT